MKNPPRDNLAPDSQGWRRWVNDGILDLNTRLNVISNNVTNLGKALGGSLRQLGNQIETLSDQQSVQEGLIETLGEQQSVQEGLIETLGEQQGQIETIVAGLPITETLYTFTTGWQAGNGEQTKVTLNPSWPAGKNNATISINFQGAYQGDYQVPNSDRAAFRARIRNGSWRSPFAVESRHNMDYVTFIGFGAIFVTRGAFPNLFIDGLSVAGPTLAPADPSNRYDLSATIVWS